MNPTWWQRIKASAFARHILTVFTGTAAAQAVNLLLLPILGRLYSVDDFGLYGVFIATISSLSLVVNGGYEAAIMLPTRPREVRSLMNLSILIGLIVSSVVGILLWAGGTYFWALWDASPLHSAQFFVWVCLLGAAIIQPVRIFLNRKKHYNIIAWARLGQVVVAGGTAVYYGYNSDEGFLGLILGYFVGQLVYTVILGVFFDVYYRNTSSDPQTYSFKKLMRLYRDFPTHGLGAGTLNALSRQLPAFLLPAAFGQDVAGWYDLARRGLMLPVSLVSRSVGEVFYQQAARAKEKSPLALQQLTRQTARYLALGAVLAIIVVWAFAPTVVAWVMEPVWRPAGVYAGWLIPWVALMFVTSPLSFLVDVQRKLDVQLRYNVALFVGRLAALLIGGWVLKDDILTLALYAGIGSLLVGWHLTFLLRIAYVPPFGRLPEES